MPFPHAARPMTCHPSCVMHKTVQKPPPPVAGLQESNRRCAEPSAPPRRTKMDLVLRGILAGLIGTVFMNLSSETEMHLRGRQPSVVPGRAVNKVLSIVGVPQL